MSMTVHHYGVTVDDLDETSEFYTDTLGLDVAMEFELEGEAFSTAVGTDDAVASFAHIDGGDCIIELVEYSPAGADVNEGVGVNNVGAAHIALAVEDVQECYDDIGSEAEFVSPPQTLPNGGTIAFLRDPEGNIIELIER